jgi:hypothetical protein
MERNFARKLEDSNAKILEKQAGWIGWIWKILLKLTNSKPLL